MPIRTVVRSLEELIRRTATDKREAASARARGRDPDAEPSAGVYAKACEEVASEFLSSGFRFAKSGPHFLKRFGDFTCKISFQTSHHNVPGQHVALLVAANVASRPLQDWRSLQSHPLRSGDFVAGGLLGNLLDDHPYIEWDLASEYERRAVVADIADAIRTIALPFFERFSDSVALCSWLRSNRLPAMWAGDAVEFALCYSDRAAASDVAAFFLRTRPALVPDFDAARVKFAQQGFPKHFPTSDAEQLAWVVASYGL